MWFNTEKYRFVYDNFDSGTVRKQIMRYHGDQDYIHAQISSDQLRFFDIAKVKSYKWEIKEGGYNFSTRKYNDPGKICWPKPDASILVFHGIPNPDQENHPLIKDNWF